MQTRKVESFQKKSLCHIGHRMLGFPSQKKENLTSQLTISWICKQSTGIQPQTFFYVEAQVQLSQNLSGILDNPSSFQHHYCKVIISQVQLQQLVMELRHTSFPAFFLSQLWSLNWNSIESSSTKGLRLLRFPNSLKRRQTLPAFSTRNTASFSAAVWSLFLLLSLYCCIVVVIAIFSSELFFPIQISAGNLRLIPFTLEAVSFGHFFIDHVDKSTCPLPGSCPRIPTMSL